ncbi:MAG: hypothetical protein IPL98_12280 [Saprospiraceae bacterium]|nr:hypothetical protein [Saprospiraceae bacterium]
MANANLLLNINNASTLITSAMSKLIQPIRQEPTFSERIVLEKLSDQSIIDQMDTAAYGGKTDGLIAEIDLEAAAKSENKELATLAIYLKEHPEFLEKLERIKNRKNDDLLSIKDVQILLALDNASIMCKNKIESLERWNKEDQEKFEEYFGTKEESARQKILKELKKIEKEAQKLYENPREHFDGSIDGPDTYAEVKTAPLKILSFREAFNIKFGQKFWDAKSQGKNSQAGTIVHELSHFKSIAGTSDHDDTYGDASNNLPTSKKLSHADSLEFYVEDQPKIS